MKMLLNIGLVCCFAVYILTGRGIKDKFTFDEVGGTRGAVMTENVLKVSNLMKDLDFDCGGTGYGELTDKLNLVLIWEDRRDDAWGKTNFDTIWMYLPPCDPLAKGTYFHEIGHVVLSHEKEEDYEYAQSEANYFAYEMLKTLGEKSPDDRKYFD